MMRYIRTYREAREYSVFDTKGWQSLLPDSLTVVTDTGEWTLRRPDADSGMGHATNVTGLMNGLQINYYQNTVEENGGDVTADGEPDQLEFDITMVKDNGGGDANPDSLRLDLDVTYGDSMKFEFSVSKPGRVEVGHYNGYGSKHDPGTWFAFDAPSLSAVVRFINSFGFSVTEGDLAFLGENQIPGNGG